MICDSISPILSIKNLVFSYQDAPHPTVKIESLEVQEGEKIFIQGASGTGKSTLLNLIAGVLTAQQGTIRVLGKDFSQLSASQKDQLRGDHMGFVFQMFNLLPYLTAIENVVLSCSFSKLKTRKTLELSKSVITEAERLLIALKLPPASLRSKNVTQLSVGQQQRIATARALMGHPEILIADEPTSALDHDVRKRFLELLFQEAAKSNTTLLFVSHDQDLAPLFDRTIELQEINSAPFEVDASLREGDK